MVGGGFPYGLGWFSLWWFTLVGDSLVCGVYSMVGGGFLCGLWCFSL